MMLEEQRGFEPNTNASKQLIKTEQKQNTKAVKQFLVCTGNRWDKNRQLRKPQHWCELSDIKETKLKGEFTLF